MTIQKHTTRLPSIDYANIQILLVEDDAFIAITQIRQLESHRYQVTHVSSGEAAVQVVKQKPQFFSLILMDIDLGSGMDGTQAAEQILTLADVPIVFLSSHSEREVVQKTEKITSYGYVVKNSGIVILDTVIKMALRLYQTHSRVLEQLELLEQARVQLEESESKYKTLFSNIEDSIFVADSESGMLIDANPKAQSLIGKTLEEMLQMHQSELHPPEMLDQVKQAFFTASKAGKKVLSRDFPVIHKNGHSIPVEINAGTNLVINGRKYHVGVFRDISDQIAMEESLKTSESLYRSIVEHTYDVIFKLDLQGVLEYLSPSWTIMLGHDVEDTLDKAFAEYIHPEDLQQCWDFIQGVVDTKARQSGVRYRVLHKDGSWRWHTASATPHLDHTGKVVGIIGSSRDIQEVVDSELMIQQQLQEKDVLVHENNHRIKNNIASIQSFLRIQGEDTQNVEAKQIIHDAVSRLEAMRIVYQRLMGVSQTPTIQLGSYIEELGYGLMNIYGNGLTGLLSVHVDDWIVSSTKASTLGSMVTELLINAMNHGGFSVNQSTDQFCITIHGVLGTKEYSISVSDTGSTLPQSFNLHTHKGFGLNLVEMMADQLQGRFELIRQPRVQWQITVPLE